MTNFVIIVHRMFTPVVNDMMNVIERKRFMGKSKKSVQIVILLAIILVGVYAVATVVFGSDKVPKVGQKAVDFELLGMDGAYIP